ncbi:head-tail adaptor protein [Sphingomicrobium sp. XHP0239]|uniref:head-tail adaptor protein n=1 Tax=Sphingomicrobium maritimum TaxID=3133972 RepID=UPI0031CCB1AC
MMDSRKLDRLITIKRPGAPVDDGYSEVPGALETYAQRWASWMPANGREVFENLGREAKSGGSFWLHYDAITAAIEPTDKIEWDGRLWEILSIAQIGRHVGIELIVTTED